MTDLIALAAIVLAGVVRGFAGFGAALIMVPALSALYGPVAAIPIMALTDTVGMMPLVPAAMRRCVLREVLPIALAAAITFPLGVQILIWADADRLATVIALMVLGFAAVLATGWRYAGPTRLPLTLATGGTSGLLGGAIGIGGPPVVLFWLAGRTDTATVRANIIAFTLFGSVVSFLTYWAEGLLVRDVLVRVIAFAPAYMLATWAGARLFGKASEALYRRIALLVITLVALASLAG